MRKKGRQRYQVIDLETGREVFDVFVLDPVNDRHARAGLIGYARSAEDVKPQLASDMKAFVARLDELDQERHERLAEIPDWLAQMDRERAARLNGEDDNDSESNPQ